MTIVDRYIVRSFLSSYLILMSIGIGFFVFVGLLVNLDEFTRDTGQSVSEMLMQMATFYGAKVPLFYSQLAGPVMAIAATFTFGTMLRNNELTALVAAGVPLQRLAIPVLVCAVGLILLWVANREQIMPPIASEIARNPHEAVGDEADGVFARDDENTIIMALRLLPDEGRMERVFFIRPDETGTPAYLIEADEAIWDEATSSWELVRGFQYVMDQDGGVAPGAITKQGQPRIRVTLSPKQLALRQNARWADYLGLNQLKLLLSSRNLPNWPTVNMSLHVRLTQPMIQLILLFLPIPFFLTREKINVITAAGKGVLLAGGFFLFMFVSHNVVRDPGYAALVAWLPILVFGPVAVYQYANLRT